VRDRSEKISIGLDLSAVHGNGYTLVFGNGRHLLIERVRYTDLLLASDTQWQSRLIPSRSPSTEPHSDSIIGRAIPLLPHLQGSKQ
jgi:hypothetical protein